MPIKVYARAKINLTLDVLGRRTDGYHQVETVMQSIGLHDCLEFTPREAGITLTVAGAGAGEEVPAGTDNLVYQAALLMREQAARPGGVKIYLTKNIPTAAGLGGGSADAAAALTALNEIWGVGLSLRELLLLGEKLGSDVPFCLLGGTALAAGRGERLTPLPPCPTMGLVLVKPSFGVSTAAVYRAYDEALGATGSAAGSGAAGARRAGGGAGAGAGEKPGTVGMVKALRAGDVDGIVQNLANGLQTAAISMHPEIAAVKTRLLTAGALGVLMSGSGSTVFGITAGRSEAQALASRYHSHGERVLVTETFNPESGKVLI